MVYRLSLIMSFKAICTTVANALSLEEIKTTGRFLPLTLVYNQIENVTTKDFLKNLYSHLYQGLKTTCIQIKL